MAHFGAQKMKKKWFLLKKAKNPQNKLRQPNTSYDKLEATLLTKMQDIQGKIEKTEDMDELQKLTYALSELLNSLEKINQMKKA